MLIQMEWEVGLDRVVSDSIENRAVQDGIENNLGT